MNRGNIIKAVKDIRASATLNEAVYLAILLLVKPSTETPAQPERAEE